MLRSEPLPPPPPPPPDDKQETFIPSLALPLILYDTFLLLNLSVSISLWVSHSISAFPPFAGLSSSLGYGSVLTSCWIAAAVYNDFYHPPNAKDEENAAQRAGATWVSMSTLLLVWEFAKALPGLEPVGNEYVFQELGFSLVLMTCWRLIYARY